MRGGGVVAFFYGGVAGWNEVRICLASGRRVKARSDEVYSLATEHIWSVL